MVTQETHLVEEDDDLEAVIEEYEQTYPPSYP